MRQFLTQAITQRPALFGATLITVFILKLSLFAPALLLGAVIDNLSLDSSAESLTIPYLLCGYALVILVTAAVAPIQTYALTRLVQQTVKDRSISWIAEIFKKEFCVFNNLRIGHLIKATDRGITAHEQILNFFITVGLPLIIEILVVSILFVHFGGAQLFAALLTASCIYLYVCHRIIQWRTRHINEVNDSEDEVSERLFSTLRAARSIKLEGAAEQTLSPLNLAFERYARCATTVASSAAALGSAKMLFIGLSTCGLLVWGVRNQGMTNPTLTIGELVALCSIAGGFLTNISGIAEAYRSAHQFMADKVKLQQTLSLPRFDGPDRSLKPPASPISSLELAACEVSGRHMTLDAPLRFKSDESVAITGPSGAGKSTLLELLAGMDGAYRQHLSLNGICVQRIRGASQLRALRYCPQSPVFLPGDLESGVMYGHAAGPELLEQARELSLDALLSQLNLNDSASNLSGGQAKRLSLLRLLNRPGRFNLFDEPTASLDQELAMATWDTLMDAFKGKGLICVTHDIEALARFDRVLVIQQGRIVADGPWHLLRREAGLLNGIAEMAER
ncbi:ATP-binding cassette domain-containing protein [Pseudomonas coleopterorum]|uniref:ATP-binding cassette domain-containing protein n=1 Tax=Pseudomonas coleopterorum TaxID=1605838 RepID=UPI002A6A8308|nr:ATP-binding cassette domain-containing protein [Pseudomonas coleopterorum]MDY1047742.1 ATP-binding cassette domain-containing protein [Pseudomonas coleopterorum]